MLELVPYLTLEIVSYKEAQENIYDKSVNSHGKALLDFLLTSYSYVCAKWQIRARRKPIHLNFFKRNGCSRLLLGSSCIGIGASPAGPVWPDHFFGDLLRPCHEDLTKLPRFY